MLKHVARTVIQNECPVLRRKYVNHEKNFKRFSVISTNSCVTARDKVVYRIQRGRVQSFSWPSSVIEPQVYLLNSFSLTSIFNVKEFRFKIIFLFCCRSIILISNIIEDPKTLHSWIIHRDL